MSQNFDLGLCYDFMSNDRKRWVSFQNIFYIT